MKRKLIGALVGAAVMSMTAGQALAQAKAPAAKGMAAKPGGVKLSGEMVKIGVLTDMSGVYSDLGGQGSVTSAQMAIDDFKAQSKPGWKIELVYAEH